MTTWWTFGGLGSDSDDDDDIFSSGSGYSSYGSYYGKKYKSSLGWSKNKLTDTTSYYSRYWGESSYSGGSDLGSDKKTERDQILLMTKAYKAVRDMVIILDFPFDVVIKLSNYSSPGIVGRGRKTRTLCIPSDVMDYSEYTDEEKISIVCGLGTHEASHLKYTEYKTYKTYMKDAERSKKFFVNLLEDMRIEDKLLSERPGYLNFIEDSIKFRYLKLEKSVNAYKCDVKIKNIIFNLIKFIRFPDKIDPKVVEEYEKYFKEFKSILLENHTFTKDSCLIGEKLVEKLKYMFYELKYDTYKINEFIDHICPDESFELKYGIDGGNAMFFGSETAKILGSGTLSTLYSEVISGKVELGEGNKTYVEKPEGNQIIYSEIKDRISKYVPGIKKLITGTDKNYDFIIHGCREGALDTNKLAEAYQGVPQVYLKKGKVTTNKTTVCVLIDQSGSMFGQKAKLAREAAVLLNEALKDLPGVDLYIYGHSADIRMVGDTIIYAYREGNKYAPKCALSAANAHSNNRDGVAILETAKRIRKHTQDDCIMFVLSDGSPAAHYYCGYTAVEDTKKKVKEVEGMGFTVIQVSIDFVNYAKEMFTNVISLEYDLANLPKRLSQMIKKTIVRSKTTTVS